MKNLEKSRNMYIRDGIIWIDFQKDKKRIRRSTGIKNSPLAIKFVKKHYDLYVESKENILDLKIAFNELENSEMDKKLQDSDNIVKKIVNNKLSFENIIQDLLTEKSFLKFKTISTYETASIIILRYLHKNKIYLITDFNRKDSIYFINYLQNKNYKLKTIRLYCAVLNMIFNYAVENELIKSNPFFMPRLKKELENTDTINVFDMEEVVELIKKAKGELKTFLILGFFTGARTGEILALTFEDLDFKNKEIRINKTLGENGILNSPKTASSNRVIDMLDIVKTELEKLKFKKSSEKIFKFKRIKIRNEFNLLQEKLNMKQRRLYDTRHSFASIMLSRGEEPMWVGCKMMGHKNLNETYKTYAKYLPKKVVQRANFLRDFDI